MIKSASMSFSVMFLLWGAGGNLWSVCAVNADVIYRRGNNPPLVGKIITESPSEIEFEEIFLSGSSKRRNVFRADTIAVIRTIDNQRLAQLTPGKPADYFEYAEELTAYKQDFVAQQLAVRLYLIAAKNSSGNLTNSSFLGLLKTAENSEQAKRIRALALLHLDDENREHLMRTIGDRKQQNQNGKESLLQAILLLRSGKLAEAGTLLKEPNVRAAADQFQKTTSWQTLYGLSRVKQLTLEQLRTVVRVELELRQRQSENAASRPGINWNTYASQPAQAKLQWIGYDNVTPYDPAQDVFRDGKWQSSSRQSKNKSR